MLKQLLDLQGSGIETLRQFDNWVKT